MKAAGPGRSHASVQSVFHERAKGRRSSVPVLRERSPESSGRSVRIAVVQRPLVEAGEIRAGGVDREGKRLVELAVSREWIRHPSRLSPGDVVDLWKLDRQRPPEHAAVP